MYFSVTRSTSECILLFSLTLLGLGGVSGGHLLMYDPTGNLLNISSDYINVIPFEDYYFPGFSLFLVLGIIPLVISYFAWKKYPYTWRAALIVGIVVMLGTAIMVYTFGIHMTPLFQLIYGFMGGVIVICALFFKPKYYS